MLLHTTYHETLLRISTITYWLNLWYINLYPSFQLEQSIIIWIQQPLWSYVISLGFSYWHPRKSVSTHLSITRLLVLQTLVSLSYQLVKQNRYSYFMLKHPKMSPTLHIAVCFNFIPITWFIFIDESILPLVRRQFFYSVGILAVSTVSTSFQCLWVIKSLIASSNLSKLNISA